MTTISVLIFFGIAFAAVFLLRMARIGTLLAFLLAGIIAGPHLLGLFELSNVWEFLGTIGMMFLWFTIGLEINIKRLWQMKHNIFGLGLAQVMMVAVMVFPILYGITTWTIMGTIMVALMLAMSSTSTDLQLLADRNELQSKMGRQTFSILLFQDLLSIPLLAMLPIFAGKSINLGANVIDVLVMSVGLIIGAVFIGRVILSPLMRMVTKMKSKELFLLTIMLNIIVWAIVLQYVGLPPQLGAFMAGMLFSETIYRHQVRTEVAPYAILFLACFFIALGMGLDLNLLANKWYIVLGGVIALVIVKFVAIYVVARVRHVRTADALAMGLILSQGGEFGLLILQTMKTGGISAIPANHAELLIAIIVMSIMLTPIILMLLEKLKQSGILFSHKVRKIKDADAPESPRVIICGFGRVGQIIAQMLEAQKIPYVALDLSVNEVMLGQEKGFNVFYGDTSNTDVLREVGMTPRHTSAVVIALDNAAVAKKSIRAARVVSPRVKIFARARNIAESEYLQKLGVKQALPETIESSFMLGQALLSDIGIAPEKIKNTLNNMRGNKYEKIAGDK